jgi:hypothetical protein
MKTTYTTQLVGKKNKITSLMNDQGADNKYISLADMLLRAQRPQRVRENVNSWT